jgi:MFS family permease
MFLLLYVTEKHGGTANALFVYILYNTSLALSAFPIGWLSDRTSVRPVLAAGIFLVGCVYGLLPCATSFAVVSAAFIVYGMGVAAFESTSKAWVSAVVPEQQIGSAMGFLAGSQSIALLVASTVTGLIWSTDPGTAFSITGGMALLSALWILVRWPSLNS